MIAAGGPALLFRNVKGADFPLVTNLFGTRRRAELAFGERPLRLIKRLVHLAETLLPPSPSKLWGARDIGWELLKVGVRRGAAGPVTDVVTDDVRLERLPALTTWPEDGGPFITLPLVYTQHPDGRGSNLGMYRLHIHDDRSTGMHWQIGKGGGFHYQVAEARNEPLPVTVFLGGPPALILSAVAPLPENVPEMMLASLIAGERLKVDRGRLASSADRERRVRADRRRGAAPPQGRGPVRRSLRLLLARARLSGVQRAADRPAPRRDLPGDRRRQAASGGLLHRRPAAGAAVPSLSARHARRPAALVVWRNRVSRPRRRGGQTALCARGHGERLPDSGRGPAVAHQVPAGHRPGRWI